MSADQRHEGAERGGVTRREILAALARWSVPTVVTLTLGARAAHAAASCPPCTRKVGGVCRACTMSQILNCQCEPCLGPPYCPGAAPTSTFRPAPNAPFGGEPAPAGERALDTYLRQRAARERSPFAPGLGGRPDSGLGGVLRAPYGRTPGPRSLYDRLRPFDERR